jgi:hypothetical protein
MAEHGLAQLRTVDVPTLQSDQAIIECDLCGTRLRRNDEPHPTEVGTDLLTPIARHRCAPRVRRSSHAPAFS